MGNLYFLRPEATNPRVLPIRMGMHHRGILLLSVIIAAFSLGAAGYGAIEPPALGVEMVCAREDAETLLVCGRPLRLSVVDRVELELIPGITERMAEQVLANQATLLNQRQQGPSKEQVFVSLHGIGPKRARTLARFLALD
ncbi:MAG: hypothetical protein EBZ48_10585 [Proteobacteria bacterium]|nr:hypothetical protein [Pseudomonadota bacterium]